ncbi:PKD domain-containing protein [Chloroflexota bacterium]
MFIHISLIVIVISFIAWTNIITPQGIAISTTSYEIQRTVISYANNPIPQDTRTVTIPSQEPWTPANIQVHSRDLISISVIGDVIFGNPYEDNQAGPNGTRLPSQDELAYFPVMNENVPAQSVIGNIANSSSLDGMGFFIGSSFSGRVPIPNTTNESGFLFLGFNDKGILPNRSGIDTYAFTGDNYGLFTAQITIIRYSMAPMAYINPNTEMRAPLGALVYFSGRGVDEDGSIVSYAWRSSIDGLLSTASSFTTSNLSEGTHTIYLQVTDDHGFASEEVTTTIIVDPLKHPRAFIDTTNLNISPLSSGTPVSFSGHGVDEDGSIASYAWRSSIDGPLSTESSFTTSNLSEGSHTIYLQVTDDHGLQSDEVATTVIIVTRNIIVQDELSTPDSTSFWVRLGVIRQIVIGLCALLIIGITLWYTRRYMISSAIQGIQHLYGKYIDEGDKDGESKN